TVLMLQGKYNEAVEMGLKSVDLNPKNSVSWGRLASAYQWSDGGHDKAMKAYAKATALGEAALTKTPDDALLLAQLASYYAESGKKDVAVQRARKAISIAPTRPDVD